jgi:NADH-quinone oxidoreductase subunit M
VYTLRMIQRVFYGETNAVTAQAKDITLNVQVALAVIVVAILVVGIYPKPLLSLTSDVTNQIMNRIFIK